MEEDVTDLLHHRSASFSEERTLVPNRGLRCSPLTGANVPIPAQCHLDSGAPES